MPPTHVTTLAFGMPGTLELVVIFVILSVIIVPAIIGGSLMWLRLRDKMKGKKDGR
ncbi:MAG: hypothetical protein ACYTGQ_00625 [Planctomycetota bacterium]|jgi:hypothetical protein